MKLMILNFIIPVVMLLAARWLRKKIRPYPGAEGAPTKWKIDGSGYNTPQSRKSREHWRFAQQIAPEKFRQYGIISMMIALICVVLGAFLPNYVCVVISNAVGLGIVTEAFRDTEKTIEKEFDF